MGGRGGRGGRHSGVKSDGGESVKRGKSVRAGTNRFSNFVPAPVECSESVERGESAWRECKEYGH